jgi:hypothetical protein
MVIWRGICGLFFFFLCTLQILNHKDAYLKGINLNYLAKKYIFWIKKVGSIFDLQLIKYLALGTILSFVPMNIYYRDEN